MRNILKYLAVGTVSMAIGSFACRIYMRTNVVKLLLNSSEVVELYHVKRACEVAELVYMRENADVALGAIIFLIEFLETRRAGVLSESYYNSRLMIAHGRAFRLKRMMENEAEAVFHLQKAIEYASVDPGDIQSEEGIVRIIERLDRQARGALQADGVE